MTTKQRLAHLVSVVIPALGSVAIEVFAPAGALGHYHWSAAALAVAAWVIRESNATPPEAPAVKP